MYIFLYTILHVIGRHVYYLLPYEIPQTCVHWSFVITDVNLTKHFYCRHLDFAQSITIHT